MKSISFIGAGRVAQAMSIALLQAGGTVQTVASRSAESAQKLAARLPGCRAASTIVEATECDWVFLTVPDDAIATLASQLPWRSDQRVVHCSGATDVSVLAPAASRGALTGSFHPLQIFSDPVSASRNLRGSSVAIEGEPMLTTELTALANALGMHPIQLPPGMRPLYHAAAGYAASMMLCLLHEAVQLWRHLGIDEAEALRALLPLSRGTLDAVAEKGLAGGLSGPVSRGDAAVIQEHIRALESLEEASHEEIYRMLTQRQLMLAQASHRLNAEQILKLSNALGNLS